MDVSDVIARREFMPTYIWLDVAFLIGFAALLVWRRKYMTLLVGLVMGGVYFAVDYGTFNLLTHSRRQHVLGAAVDERKLWVHELLMAVVVAEPRPSSGGMVDADSRLVVLLPVDVADVYGPVRVRHAADCHPTHDRRVPRVDGRHPVAQAYGRSCGVPPIGMDTCRSGSGPSKISETPDVRTYRHQPDTVVQSYNNRSHRLSAMVFGPSRPVDDGLDVVAVRIQHECGIVPRMIRARSRSAVVSAADGERRGMEIPHGLTVRG